MTLREGPLKVDEFLYKEPTKFTGKSHKLVNSGKYDEILLRLLLNQVSSQAIYMWMGKSL